MTSDDFAAFSYEKFDGTALVPFYPLDEITRHATADIIFVPGLGGHFEETWEADDRTIWPRDMLPRMQHLDGIRVLSFQYNTSLEGSTSQAGIRDHANDLVNWLRDHREDDDEMASLRPLVFVGHSLGGIVIKHALIKMAHDIKYQNLWNASRGVMFFATPHFGLSTEKWRLFAHRVLLRRAPSKGVSPTRKMISQLKVNSEMLYRVSEDFKPLQPDLSFVTFTENTPMEGMEDLMVDKVYGLTRAETELPRQLSGDHLSLCKFKDHEDDLDEFELVSDGIVALIRDEPRAIHRLNSEHKRALYSLCPVSFHCHHRDRQPTPGTCEWVFQERKVKDWLVNSPGKEKLWIHGEPGSGKSYLAKAIIKRLLMDDNSTQHGVVHCFLSDAHPSRNSLEALQRATLHQALHFAPELVETYLAPTFEEARARKQEEQPIWTAEAMDSIWTDAMANVMAREALTLVIDGLDEIGRGAQHKFLSMLGDLSSKTQAASGTLEGSTPRSRYLFLTRNDHDLDEWFGRLDFESYHVDSEQTKKDIKKTAQAELGYLWGPQRKATGSRREEICETIAERSHGSYLWANLAVEDLKRSRKINEKQILNTLDQFADMSTAGGVDSLYELTLFSIQRDAQSCAFVKQMLTFALFQQEGLRLAELQVANALVKATTQHPAETITHDILTSYLDDNIKTRVSFHCGHLVKLQDDRLGVTHRSLTTYLSTKTSPLPFEFVFDAEECHALLASLCIAYLTIPFALTPDEPIQEFTSFESRLRRRIKTHPFLRYASLYWYKHLALAGPKWPCGDTAAQNDSLLRKEWLENETTGYAKCWTEVWWFFVRGPTERYPEREIQASKIAELPRAIDVPIPEGMGYSDDVDADSHGGPASFAGGQRDEPDFGDSRIIELDRSPNFESPNSTATTTAAAAATGSTVESEKQIVYRDRIVYVSQPPVTNTIIFTKTKTKVETVQTDPVPAAPEVVMIPGPKEVVIERVEVPVEVRRPRSPSPLLVLGKRLGFGKRLVKASKKFIKDVLDSEPHLEVVERKGRSR